MAPDALGWVETDALCLDPDARDGLLDTIVRHKVSDLVISGCDGMPLPVEFRQSVASTNCHLSGLEWLDHPSTPKTREFAISALVSSPKD